MPLNKQNLSKQLSILKLAYSETNKEMGSMKPGVRIIIALSYNSLEGDFNFVQ